LPISKQVYDLILKKLPRLTAGQKKVAEFFLAHKETAALTTIDDIAKKANVSKATIVRTARALGYDGFWDMRTELLNHLRNNLGPIERFKLSMEDNSPENDHLLSLARQEVANINATINRIDKNAIKAAAKILNDAHHIYTMGLGISTFLAQIASYILHRVTLKSSAFSYGSLNFIEQIISLQTNDVLLAFSFLPYSSGTIEAAQFAKKKNIQVISLVDKLSAPISEFSDVVLQAQTKSSVFANSLSAILVVVYTLALELVYINRQESEEALSRLEEARMQYATKRGRNHKTDRDYY